MKRMITILFHNFETLDVFGPVEIIGRLTDHFNLQFVSQTGGIITSTQNVPIVTEPVAGLSGSGHILLIPGGLGVANLLKDGQFVNDMKSLALKAEYILTVCTGSILFSKTGLLNGKKATANKRLFSWAIQESPDVNWIKKARWVKDRNIYTSSGVSAGMDMTFGFIADLLGHDIARQKSIEIEYDWKEDAGWDPFADLYP
ncbi:MAG: dimethyladenosine transferase [Deltaproteobacteria bacterium HGW-Deltaproteobacteria-1]|jgi:transcriptional regulator GlxA family with amidase domain|nr:MAG: dimethyladenosine transferase [Deltaproteobacteria bacterium HGW-Deltaproteobacteria-1]